MPRIVANPEFAKLTPRLHVQGDNRLGRRLRLPRLLRRILLQSLLPNPRGLGILLLIVGAEEIDIVVVNRSLLLLLRRLGRVDGELAGLGTVGGVSLAWVAREGGELGLEGRDVLVPAVGVRVLFDLRGLLEGLEGLDVGLGGAVTTRGGQSLRRPNHKRGAMQSLCKC